MNKCINPSKYLGNESYYLEKVLEGESWSGTGGSWVWTLEKKFSEVFGTKYAIAFNSGTSTLHAALEASGVGLGDEVISPALTVIMNTTATLHANAVPVYADINPNTFTIDPEDIARKISRRTKAIMPVSLYGLPADMDPIIELAKRYNLVVIEDNAQCVLSRYKDKLTGSIGDMASYSFETTKHMSCGEGGMVITNNEEYARLVRKIGGHGFKNLSADEGRIRLNQDIFQDPLYKRHDVLGWNYRLSEFNAAVALAQLEKIDYLVDLRKRNAEIFLDVMSSCDYLIPQQIPDHYTHSYYTLGIVYEGFDVIGVSWKNFRKLYIDEGGDGIYGACSIPYFEPVIEGRGFVKRNPHIYDNVYYYKDLCPVAERIQPKLMQFKTNYRDLHLAKEKAGALRRTIKKLKKGFR